MAYGNIISFNSQPSEWTMLAVGLCLFAELLAELHQQGVVFTV